MFSQFKGQGIIIEILLFAISIFLAIMTFMILASTDTVFENNVEAEVQNQIDFINEKSVLDIMLDDPMWRSSEIDKDKYGDVSAAKVTSYYFSTDDSIDINGNTHSHQEVGEDLGDYYEDQLENYFSIEAFGGYATFQRDYVLNITKNDQYIDADSQDGWAGRWSRMDRPIHLSNGETAELTFWIKSHGEHRQ